MTDTEKISESYPSLSEIAKSIFEDDDYKLTKFEVLELLSFNLSTRLVIKHIGSKLMSLQINSGLNKDLMETLSALDDYDNSYGELIKAFDRRVRQESELGK